MTISVEEVSRRQGGERARNDDVPMFAHDSDAVPGVTMPQNHASSGAEYAHHRGRPRMSGLTGRILQEVYEAVGRDGYAAFSLEMVVKHSNTTRTTVYRRWRSKADLVSHALVARGFSEVPEDDATLNFLGAVWRRLQSEGLSHATALNIVSALVDPEIRQHMREYEKYGESDSMIDEPVAIATKHADSPSQIR